MNQVSRERLVVSKGRALKHVGQLVDLLGCEDDPDKDSQVKSHVETINAILEQGQSIETLANDFTGIHPRALVLHYPSREPIVIDYQDNLGAALFGKPFMRRVKGIVSSKLYLSIALPLSTLGGVSLMISLLPGFAQFGIVSCLSVPVYLIACLFVQRTLFLELITGFDQVFLLCNMFALAISFCVLFKWHPIRSAEFLLFIPISAVPAIFADATSYKMRRNARMNYIMGCLGYGSIALALLADLLDVEDDVMLLPGSLDLSLIQRCVSFCTNVVIFNFRFAVVTVLRPRGDLLNTRSLIISKRIANASQRKEDLIVLTPTQAAELFQPVQNLYQLCHHEGQAKAQQKVHILREIFAVEALEKDKISWRLPRFSKQKVAPANAVQSSCVKARSVHGTQAILVSLRKPYVVDTSQTIGKLLLGEKRMRKLAYLNRQRWFIMFVLISTISGAASVIIVQLPGCEMFGILSICCLPVYLSTLSFMHVETLQKLLFSFDQVFLFGNILVYSVLVEFLMKRHPVRFISTVLLTPLFSFAGVFSDALPHQMRANSKSIFPPSCCLFIFAALGIQLGVTDMVGEPVVLFPGSLNISVEQRCFSFAINAAFFYFKLSLRLIGSPGAFTTLKGAIRPLYLPKLENST